MTRAAPLLAGAAARLEASGIAEARREARLLLAHVTGLGAERFVGADLPVDGDAARRFGQLVERRARRVPLSHIVRRRGFWTLELEVGAEVLDPRPDSETLISALLGAIPDRRRPLRVLDLGTGSGCLLLALLAELPQAWGLGVDRSAAALTIAARNARRHDLADRTAWLRSDWDAAIAGRFDVMVSNPPYIPSADIPALMPEVALHEPRLALDGGADGLVALERVAAAGARLLAPGGLAAIEFGQGQSEAVSDLLAGSGLTPVRLHHDLGKNPRCWLATP